MSSLSLQSAKSGVESVGGGVEPLLVVEQGDTLGSGTEQLVESATQLVGGVDSLLVPKSLNVGVDSLKGAQEGLRGAKEGVLQVAERAQLEGLEMSSDSAEYFGLFKRSASDTMEAFGRLFQGELERATGRVREVGVELIYGAESKIVEGAQPSALREAHSLLEPILLTENLFFKLSILFLFALFALVLYYNRGHLRSLFSIIRGRHFLEELLDENNHSFDNFLITTLLFGFATMGFAMSKLVEIFAAEQLQWVGSNYLLLIPIALTVGTMLLYWFQNFVTNAIGAFVYKKEFTDNIIRLKGLVFSLMTYLLAPLVFLLLLSSGSTMDILLYLCGSLLFAILIFYVWRLFLLFFHSRISIFYSFLYLCFIEVLPILTIVLLVVRFL